MIVQVVDCYSCKYFNRTCFLKPSRGTQCCEMERVNVFVRFEQTRRQFSMTAASANAMAITTAVLAPACVAVVAAEAVAAPARTAAFAGRGVLRSEPAFFSCASRAPYLKSACSALKTERELKLMFTENIAKLDMARGWSMHTILAFRANSHMKCKHPSMAQGFFS